MRSKYILIFVLVAFFALQSVWAQPGGGGPGGGGDPDVPITGVEILLIIGGVLGVRKYLSSRKN